MKNIQLSALAISTILAAACSKAPQVTESSTQSLFRGVETSEIAEWFADLQGSHKLQGEDCDISIVFEAEYPGEVTSLIQPYLRRTDKRARFPLGDTYAAREVKLSSSSYDYKAEFVSGESLTELSGHHLKIVRDGLKIVSVTSTTWKRSFPNPFRTDEKTIECVTE